jgi:hypothetical protein
MGQMYRGIESQRIEDFGKRMYDLERKTCAVK